MKTWLTRSTKGDVVMMKMLPKAYVNKLPPLSEDESDERSQECRALIEGMWGKDPTLDSECPSLWDEIVQGVSIRIAQVDFEGKDWYCCNMIVAFEVSEGEIGEIGLESDHESAQYFMVAYEGPKKVVLVLVGRAGQKYQFLRNGEPLGKYFQIATEKYEVRDSDSGKQDPNQEFPYPGHEDDMAEEFRRTMERMEKPDDGNFV